MRKVLYIFGLLTDADVEWMARAGRRRRLTDGEVVIKQGEISDYVLFVLDGELQVTADEFGHIARLGVGEVVGEVSLVDSAPPSATVTAHGDCLALVLDKTKLMQKLDVDEGFGCRFYRALAIYLADRLRAARQLPSGKSGIADKTTILQDELDLGILDNLSAAGEQFNRMLKILRGD